MPAKITINPDIMGDTRDALAVAYNEAYRVLMEQNDFEPQAEPTEEQVQFFADTAYANDPLQMKRTITARIATYDTSVPNPTPEQYQDVVDMLNMVIDSGAITNDEEESVVTSTLEDMEAKVSGGQGEQGMPPEGLPLEQLAPQEAMPPEGMEGMPPEMMGQESGGLEQLNPAMLQQLMGAGTQAAVKAGVVDEEEENSTAVQTPEQPVAQTTEQPAAQTTEQPSFPKQPTQADIDAYNQMETRIQELIKAGNDPSSGLIQGLMAAQAAAWGRATGQENSETQRQIDNDVVNGTHTDLTMPSGERWRIYGTNGVGGVDPEAMKYMNQVSRDANYSTNGRFRRGQMTKYLRQEKFTNIKISGEGVDRNAGLAARATAIAEDLQAKGPKAVANARKAYEELSALDPDTLPRNERLMLQTLGRALGEIPAEQAAQATPATTGATTPPATTATPATTETKKTEKAEENPLEIEETTEDSDENPADTVTNTAPEGAAPEEEVLAEPTLTRTDEANRDLADGASAAISSTGSWAQLARDVVLSAKTEVKRLVGAGRLATDTVEKVNGIIKNLSNADPAVVRKAAADLRKLIPGEASKELLESLGKLSTAAGVKPLEVNVSKGLSVSGTAAEKVSAASQNAVHQITQQVEQVPTEKLGIEAPKAPDMSVSGMEKFRETLSPDELKQVELFESSGGKQGKSLQQMAAVKYSDQVLDMFDKIPVEARANFLGEVQKAMVGNKAFPEKAKALITAWAEGKPVDMGEFKKLLQDSPDIATGLNKALGVSSVGGKIKNSWVGKLAGKAGSKVGAFLMKHPKFAKGLSIAGTVGGAISAGVDFFKAAELDNFIEAMEADLADIEKTGPLYTEDYDETVEELRDAIEIAKQRRYLSAFSGAVGVASTAADFIPGAAPVAMAADLAMMAGEAGANYFINKTEQLLAESRAENKAARDAWKSAEGVYNRFIGQSIASDLGSVDGKTKGTYSNLSLNTLLEEQGGLYKETFDQLMGNPNSQMAKTMKTQSWMKDNVSFSMLPVQVRVEFFNKLKELGMAKADGISKDYQRKRLIDREKARKSLENPIKEPGEGAGRS